MEGVPAGAVGGLSESDLSFIRKELLWSASEAAECAELKQATKKLQELEKQLVDGVNLTKYDTLAQAAEVFF